MILYTAFGYKAMFGETQRCLWFECVQCVNKPIYGPRQDHNS